MYRLAELDANISHHALDVEVFHLTAFTSITVTGTYKKADGTTPASGNVTFLLRTMTDSSNNQIAAPH